MPFTTRVREHEPQLGHRDERVQLADDPIKLTVPPAVIGFLLLLAVVLACVFYIAAQVVHTP